MQAIKVAFLSIFLVVLNNATLACATCQATIESTNSEEGASGLAMGLYNGILYLMIIPYILLFLLFRKRIMKFFREFNSIHK